MGGIAGTAASYYGEVKNNYNAGKIKTKSGKNITKAAIFASTSGNEVVVRKRKQGSLRPHQISVSWKDWIPKAKKKKQESIESAISLRYG